jgi:hypothetical protein
MTLTITLVADGLIVQTSDHRLTEQPGSMLITDEEPKQMYALADDWAAVVGFAGIGYVRTDSRIIRASDIAYDAVTKAGRKAGFAATADAIATGATRWLRAVTGDRRHSFVMAGLVVQSPEVITRVAVISNWQRPDVGADAVVATIDTAARDHFDVSIFDTYEPAVLAMGCHPAVRQAELFRIKRMANAKRSTRQIASVMSYVNGAASQRPAAKDAVSRHCTSVAILLSRRQINGEATAHTEGREQPVPVLQGNAVFRNALERTVAELQAKGEIAPGIVAPPRSSTFAKSVPVEFRDLPYTTPADPLWVDSEKTAHNL